MSLELFTPPPSYTVAGVGPYGVTHPYTENSLQVIVILGSERVELDPETDFSVSPSAGTSGNIFLSAGASATYNGWKAYIQRATSAQQGWLGTQGAREAGLERQLDLITMVVQEIQQQLGNSLRTERSLTPFAPQDGQTIIFEAGHPVAGPTADQIEGAQTAAEEAALAAAEAIAAAEFRVKSPADFFGRVTEYPVGSRVRADTGEAWDIVTAGTGDLIHPVSGIGVTVVRTSMMSLTGFRAAGDGVTDDTAAWNMFQAAVGPKRVNPGQYLVNGAIRRFDAGCLGNGEYDDTTAAWDQLLGDRERDSIIVHSIDTNANDQLLSPLVKLQRHVHYEVDTPSSQFKRITGFWCEQTLTGYYNTLTDQNNNFTVMGAATKNMMSGLFGSLASTWYCSDATELENPDILTYGATKNGAAYFQATKRTRYSSGGYMFCTEAIFLNTSADSDTPIPYSNDDNFGFTAWTAAGKFTAQSDSAPGSTGILVNGSSTAKHTFWNGIVIGGSALTIDGVREGAAGTVGLNMASWRPGVAYGEVGIKMRTANRHLYFVEGAKIRSAHSRFMYASGAAGISIEGQAGATQYLNFRDGATTDADGGAVTNRAQLLATTSQFTMVSPGGELIFSPVGVASFRMNSARLAPVTDNAFALGNTSARWTTVYAATGTINTSDARQKTDIAPITDEVLDAWGDVQFVTYRWLDAIAAKGDDAARVHYGVIAQQVRDAFLARGIDATRFGLLCHDVWDDTPARIEVSNVEVTPARYAQVLIKAATFEDRLTDGGETVSVEISPAEYADGDLIAEAVFEEIRTEIPAVPAGDRWGIRADQCHFIEAAFQRRRAERMEARLAQIETRLQAAGL